MYQGHTASDAIKRVYHLEDGGFIPIVTNHGSAIDSSPVHKGITFTKLSQGSLIHFGYLKQLMFDIITRYNPINLQYLHWIFLGSNIYANGNEGIDISSRYASYSNWENLNKYILIAK